jgi:hypothetical protein
MSLHTDDIWIDDELKNVAIPADLLDKLQAIVSLDDCELDRELCNVSMPAGLLDRLRSIGSLDEVDVDDELRHVVLPMTLAERLRRIPGALRHVKRKSPALHRLAHAASLLVAAGLGFLAAMSSSWFTGPTHQPGANVVADKSQPRKDSVVRTAPRVRTNDRSDEELFPPLPNDGDSRVVPPVVDPLQPNSTPLVNVAPKANEDTSETIQNSTEKIVAAPVTETKLPPLDSMPEPVWRGIAPPRVPGYDLMFQLRHGVHPIVSPAANAELAVCPVPLVTSSASFDLALRSTQAQTLLPAHKIRTEEFLAAMDYGFALPENRRLVIRTAAGPSPWRGPGLSLLQVAAQAGLVSQSGDRPSHLTIVLDASASMRWESRWETALDGLAEFLDRMQSQDRLSLVILSEKPELLAERQSRDEARRTIQSLRDRTPAISVNIVDGLVTATENARRNRRDRETSSGIVLITDGLVPLDNETQQRVEQLLHAAAEDGHRIEILDVRQEETVDGQLNRIASAADTPSADSSGVVDHSPTASSIRWSLLDIARRRSHTVATDARMKVTFKPDAVAMYRLLGHEATSVAGLMNTTVEAELRSGEAATGLFEVALKPGGGETVATVELSWRDADTGQLRTAQQSISRLQFAPSFYEAPQSLQMAALAAETAEILRDSYFAPPNSHSLSAVAELAGHLSPRFRDRPSFARLMTLVEQAQRSATAKP